MYSTANESGADPSCSSRASSASGVSRRRTGRDLFLCSTATVRRRNESDDDFLARVTHLRLQNKGIYNLGSAEVCNACPSLKVLYLYDNHVESLKGLEMLLHLEQLHVDNNLLTTVEGALPLRRLTKLHLSGNCIGTVCGLETARCLEELHVAKQRLPEGERFTIDRTSIDGIKDSLVVLDVSGNGMGGEEIELLLDLYRLEALNLANNDIQEISQVVDVVTGLEALTDCDLRGNAVCRMAKYYERAVTRCGDCLKTLDGKPVHPQHRSMLQKLDSHKRSEERKKTSRRRMVDRAPMAESITPAPSESWGGVRKGLLVASPGQSRHSERSQGLTGVSLEVSNLAQPANIAHSAVKSAVKSSPEDTNNQPPLASWTQSR
eukprot:jgi/Undpi1/1754/HiC_scaffold_11.g05143.m1